MGSGLATLASLLIAYIIYAYGSQRSQYFLCRTSFLAVSILLPKLTTLPRLLSSLGVQRYIGVPFSSVCALFSWPPSFFRPILIYGRGYCDTGMLRVRHDIY